MSNSSSISRAVTGVVSLADAVFRRLFKASNGTRVDNDELKHLADKVRCLAGTLHSLAVTASAFEGEIVGPSPRLDQLESCRRTLLAIDNGLANSLQGGVGPSFPSNDTRDLFQDIEEHTAALTEALSAISLEALLKSLSQEEAAGDDGTDAPDGMDGTLDITTRVKLDNEARRIIDYFMEVDHQPHLEAALKSRHPMTALWITENDTLKQWRRGVMPSIWLNGAPGVGKTILAGSIIEETLKLSSPSVAVAFYFCDHGDNLSILPVNVLGAIAAQVGMQNRDAFSRLNEVFKEARPPFPRGERPPVPVITRAILDMADVFDHLYIIVDGVDECGDQTNAVLEELMVLATSRDSIRMALLSRNEQSIQEKLQRSFTDIEISAQEEDLQLYVAAEVEERILNRNLRIDDMCFKDELIKRLVRGANGR
jgi:hypothetical protein